MQPTSCTDIINQQLTCGPSALHLPIQLLHTKQCHSFQCRLQFFNLQGIRYRSHYHHQAVFVQPVQRQNSTTDFRLTFRQWIAGLTYSLATSYAIQTSHTPTYRLLLACIHLAKVAVNIPNAIVRLGQYGTRRRLMGMNERRPVQY